MQIGNPKDLDAAREAIAMLKSLVRMNRGLDWCDPDEQARRWLEAESIIAKFERKN